MTMLRKTFAIVVFAISLPAWCEQAPASTTDEDARASQLVKMAWNLIQAKRPAEAMPYVDGVIAAYEARFKETGATRLLAARTNEERDFYFTVMASKKQQAKMVPTTWPHALFVKGYALVELDRIGEARSMLERAVDLAPGNATYRAELAYTQLREKDFEAALKTYSLSAVAAREFSPPEKRNAELAGAWRGMGYIYVELNRLADAEEMYRKCLALDANDVKASSELRYVLNLRKSSSI